VECLKALADFGYQRTHRAGACNEKLAGMDC
jgi:hypothetical protein